jgi:hypothetical protein
LLIASGGIETSLLHIGLAAQIRDIRIVRICLPGQAVIGDSLLEISRLIEHLANGSQSSGAFFVVLESERQIPHCLLGSPKLPERVGAGGIEVVVIAREQQGFRIILNRTRDAARTRKGSPANVEPWARCLFVSPGPESIIEQGSMTAAGASCICSKLHESSASAGTQ